jgi:chorismate dehydratase
VAVASRGEVRSVGLYHRRPLESLRRVAVDASSHTSGVLLRVLLHEALGREPEYVTRPPDLPAMLADADAALLIGDPALYYEGDVERWDLGSAWARSTGLPFVYAFWAGRAEAVTDHVVARLQDAGRHGRSELPRVASSYNGHGAGREAFNEAYLRDNIVYDFGPAEQAGLLAFYRRAKERGLLARVPELRFHGRS